MLLKHTAKTLSAQIKGSPCRISWKSPFVSPLVLHHESSSRAGSVAGLDVPTQNRRGEISIQKYDARGWVFRKDVSESYLKPRLASEWKIPRVTKCQSWPGVRRRLSVRRPSFKALQTLRIRKRLSNDSEVLDPPIAEYTDQETRQWTSNDVTNISRRTIQTWIVHDEPLTERGNVGVERGCRAPQISKYIYNDQKSSPNAEYQKINADLDDLLLTYENLQLRKPSDRARDNTVEWQSRQKILSRQRVDKIGHSMDRPVISHDAKELIFHGEPRLSLTYGDDVLESPLEDGDYRERCDQEMSTLIEREKFRTSDAQKDDFPADQEDYTRSKSDNTSIYDVLKKSHISSNQTVGENITYHGRKPLKKPNAAVSGNEFERSRATGDARSLWEHLRQKTHG